jgi:hypothetical protein
MSDDHNDGLSPEQLNRLVQRLDEDFYNSRDYKLQRPDAEVELATTVDRPLRVLAILTSIAAEGASFAEVLVQAKRMTGDKPSAPPSTFLLDLLMKPDEAKDAAANLEDYFPAWVAKHGARRASRIFRFQAGRILVGYWWGRIMTQVERVVKTVSVFVRPGGN